MFSQYICRLTRFWRLGSLRASDVLGAWTARHLVVRIRSDPSGALSACGALEIERSRCRGQVNQWVPNQRRENTA